MKLLEVNNLSVSFNTMRGPLHAIDRISFGLEPGETLGIVGESGCGKSITSLAIMGLLPPNALLKAALMTFAGKELTTMPESARRALRGCEIGMIFQDPMTSLNPCFTVGQQITETLRVHEGGTKQWRKSKAIELLNRVGIPDAVHQLDSYPHQLSGGMCQRIMIAIAISCKPKLLIADEPTTALDVTIQAQILDLLRDLRREEGMGLVLITHDIAVVAEMADRIAVMYAGQIVESGPTRDVIMKPSHPYTEGLLKCLPAMHGPQEHKTKLPSIPGLVPDLVHRPPACQLNPRCPYRFERCTVDEPANEWLNGRFVKCHRPLNAAETAGART